ncbi:hypothetical protein [Rhodococcus daqingensis]|uniref:Secreted protein n=1 Tax=Rhodococcus daqingensis TaxID=2479363 RepID=A0ABW2RW20_9NOCA
MNRRLLITAGALAIGIGTVLAPAAGAQGGAGEYQLCSDQFRVPIAQDAWVPGNHAVVFSPYGTDRIYCQSWHGFTSVYQLDPAGKRHALTPPEAFVGSSRGGWSKVYVWNF